MNRRRKLLVALGAGAIAPRAVLAQSKEARERAGKPARVGILERTTQAKYQQLEKTFVDAMRELGWVEGRNVVYDRAYADDDVARLPGLAAALVGRRPDVIYTITSESSQAAFDSTRTIPIVMGSLNDIEEFGYVNDLARPGGNVTGITNFGMDLGGKRLQLLKEALPKVTRVGVLIQPLRPTGFKELKLIEQASQALAVAVTPAPVKQPGELDTAFTSLSKSRVEAVLTTHTQLFLTERKRILDLAAGKRIPVIAHRSEMADDGALLSYSSILADQIRRASYLVDKILKGVKPADLPVERPIRFELVVNKNTAKTLGITIPQSILLRADKVIE
jgi:putative ABC transport system substrate-binding protein